MNRTVIVLVGSFASLVPAAAQVVRVSTPTFMADADRWVGRTVRVAALRCVDEPRGRIACGTSSGGRRLRVEGLALDFQTSTTVRRKLSARCRTDLASASDACTFDVEFKPLAVTREPSGAGSKTQAFRVKAQRINLF